MSSFLQETWEIVKDFGCSFLANFGPRGIFAEKDVKGQIVLITGAGNGLGRLLAFEFAKRGSTLVLWDVDEKGNKETAERCRSYGVEVFTYTVDLSTRESVYSVADRVKSEVGHVAILVNNAGILLQPGDFLAKSDTSIEKTFAVNTLAHAWMAKAFLPNMIETNSGHIVCVASLAAIVGAKDLVDYSASKFGAFGLQESIENEMYDRGVTNVFFTTICPIYFTTSMIDDIPLSDKTERLTPEYVVENAIEAILTNQRMLILPRKAYILYAIKGLLPRRTFQKLVMAHVPKQ